LKDVEKYIESVLTGKRNAGELEVLAVKRFLRLKKDKRYFFDIEEVNRVFNISKLFKHTSGEYYKKQFSLLPWQKFTIANLFGFKRKDTGKRLIRKAYISIAKKNGKSEFAAFLGAMLTFFDSENGAEVYSAANKYDQATICWNAARIMTQLLAEESEGFAEMIKIYDSITTRSIKFLANESFFKPIAADSKTLDGIRAHGAIIDEYHEAKSDDILRNLSSAMVNRQQPMLVIITTAGFNIGGPCHTYERVGEDILREKKQDDTSFILIFRADEDDDWHNETIWEKSNPSLGVTPTLEGLQTEYVKAINEGSTAEVAFKTKNLNIWVRASKTWIQDKVWQHGQSEWTLEDMKGEPCYMGVDLSNTSDVTCIGLLFPPNKDRKEFRFHLESFIPEDISRKRSIKDGVPYQDWHKNGQISYTPGNWIDFEHIEGRIKEILGIVKVESIAYDKWQSESTAQRLISEGVKAGIVRAFAQTTRNFNEPIKFLEKTVNNGLLDHGNNEVLRWMAGNVVLYRDASGLLKFDKRKSREKIDGMVVLGMCMGDYLDFLKSDEIQPYENHGVRYL
jgi:phage terminase large subunit-like protein